MLESAVKPGSRLLGSCSADAHAAEHGRCMYANDTGNGHRRHLKKRWLRTVRGMFLVAATSLVLPSIRVHLQ